MAKRFKFNLEKYSRLKKQELKMKELEIMNIRSDINRIETQKSTIENDIVSYRKEIFSSMKHSRVGDINQFNNFILSLQRQANELVLEISELNSALERTKQEYIEQRKEVMSFEKLYERKFQKYMYELGREEQKQIDSFAQNKK